MPTELPNQPVKREPKYFPDRATSFVDRVQDDWRYQERNKFNAPFCKNVIHSQLPFRSVDQCLHGYALFQPHEVIIDRPTPLDADCTPLQGDTYHISFGPATIAVPSNVSGYAARATLTLIPETFHTGDNALRSPMSQASQVFRYRCVAIDNPFMMCRTDANEGFRASNGEEPLFGVSGPSTAVCNG